MLSCMVMMMNRNSEHRSEARTAYGTAQTVFQVCVICNPVCSVRMTLSLKHCWHAAYNENQEIRLFESGQVRRHMHDGLNYIYSAED